MYKVKNIIEVLPDSICRRYIANKVRAVRRLTANGYNVVRMERREHIDKEGILDILRVTLFNYPKEDVKQVDIIL